MVSPAAAVGSFVAAVNSPAPVAILTVFVITVPLIVVFGYSLGDQYAASKAPSGTHLLIDLVRDPDGASGYSSALVRSIARFPPDVVTGTCPDPKVWSAAYEGNADAVEQTPDGKTHFVLHPKI